MKFLTTIALTIAVLLGSGGVSWSDWEPEEPFDGRIVFQKGLTAYRSGDYATALRDWTPLAEQGYVLAQNNMGLM